MVSVWDLGLYSLNLLKNTNVINIAQFMLMQLANEFLCSIIGILCYVCCSHPIKAKQLWTYQAMMINEARRCGGHGWLL